MVKNDLQNFQENSKYLKPLFSNQRFMVHNAQDFYGFMHINLESFNKCFFWNDLLLSVDLNSSVSSFKYRWSWRGGLATEAVAAFSFHSSLAWRLWLGRTYICTSGMPLASLRSSLVAYVLNCTPPFKKARRSDEVSSTFQCVKKVSFVNWRNWYLLSICIQNHMPMPIIEGTVAGTCGCKLIWDQYMINVSE